MKGLLMKDWLVLWRKNKIIIFILFSSVVVSPFLGSHFYLILAFPIAFTFTGMLSVTTISFDEQSKWEQYAITMPYSRKELVLSKFVFIIIALSVISLLSFFAWAILIIFHGNNAIDIEILMILLMVSISIGLVLPAINLPLVIKLGAEKGRTVTIISAILIVIFWFDFLITSNIFSPILARINIALLPILALALLGVSAFISLKIYEKREL